MSQPQAADSPTADVLRRLMRKTEAAGDCLVYTGGAGNRSGHRTISFQGRTRLVHRVTWLITHGPIPDGLCVLHRCDNPPCVNVTHLFLGTVGDNNADRDAKGRGKLPRPDQIKRRKAGPIVHGTLTAYVKRNCRCEECRRAHSDYRAQRKALGHPPVDMPKTHRVALDKVVWP